MNPAPNGNAELASAPARSALLLSLYATMVILWGSNFLFTTVALRSFGPLLVVQIRMLLAGATLGLVVLLTKRALPRTAALWGHFVVLGLICIALPYALLTWAQLWVPSSIAVTLSSTTPIFVFLISVAVTRAERFEGLRLLAIALAFGGVTMLAASDQSAAPHWAWAALIILSSCLFAAANVYTRAFVREVDPVVTAFLQIGLGAAWLIPATTAAGQWQVEELRIDATLAVLEMGPIGTAFTFVLFFYFIKNWGSTAASLNTYLQPVVGVVLGVAILGEQLHARDWLALTIILSGVAMFGWTTVRKRGR